MKVLILTGRFGLGHVKCSETLKDVILKQSPDADVEIIDLIKYMLPTFSNLIYKTFGTLVSQFSRLYNRLNQIVEMQKTSAAPLKLEAAKRVKKLMDEKKPDLIVVTLPICVQYYSAYRERFDAKVPFYVYITDITFHREWIAPGVDLYFVGGGATRHALAENGVPREKIHVTGIPVSSRFEPETEFARRKKVLVMGGGLGLVPGGRKTLDVLDGMTNVDITLLCGNNKKLQQTVARHYRHFRVIGFSDKVPELFRDADALITKPGGITIFEAIKSQTPLYIIAPTLEQELGNAAYIERHNLGRIVKTVEEFTADDLYAFLSDGETLNAIKQNMKELTENMENPNPLAYFKKPESQPE